jgi:transposase-like protein
MTDHADSTLSVDLLETIAENGLDYLPEALRLLLNAAMLLERQKYLGVQQPYERTDTRRDQANGFKDKTLTTRLGALTVAVPQVRRGEFYPSSLEKGLRSERALKLALAEMYVQGVATRRVAQITEQLCGVQVSASQVSQAAAQLDAVLDAWRNRTLGEFRYVYLDARYENVRIDGHIRDVALLIALGVDPAGKRHLLGVSVSLSEAEVHWRQFLQSLVSRGLRGVRLLISDDHAGLKAARKAVFGGVPWQRCQFHLQQNAQALVHRQEQKAPLAAALRAVFNAVNVYEAETLLSKLATECRKNNPKLTAWLEENIPEGLTVFSFPEAHRRLLRTTNGLERVNQEVRRRTRVCRHFPNEASCLRLVSAVLMEISDEWETGKAYLTFND